MNICGRVNFQDLELQSANSTYFVNIGRTCLLSLPNSEIMSKIVLASMLLCLRLLNEAANKLLSATVLNRFCLLPCYILPFISIIFGFQLKRSLCKSCHPFWPSFINVLWSFMTARFRGCMYEHACLGEL